MDAASEPLTFGSLFAGIGGFDLGFERAGMVCKWQVEIDDYATRVLRKHWPQVRRHDDIRTFPPKPAGDWRVDVVCGGFPCQDISYAGKGAGLAGERSGLFYEAMRVIREVEPRYVVLENVAALLTRGLDQVLGTLASFGFDAEWHCIPAAAVGAPHIRDRVFVVAYAKRDGRRRRSLQSIASEMGGRSRTARREGEPQAVAVGRGGKDCSARPIAMLSRGSDSVGEGEVFSDANSQRIGPQSHSQSKQPQITASRRGNPLGCSRSEWWATEPDVGRVANGVPDRSHRLRGLGNAVVPQVAQWIGERLVEYHNETAPQQSQVK